MWIKFTSFKMIVKTTSSFSNIISNKNSTVISSNSTSCNASHKMFLDRGPSFITLNSCNTSR